MRLGTYLFALVLPPVYLFTRGRVVSGIVATVLCGIACLLFLTIFFAIIGLIFWAAASFMGVFEARRQFLGEHAEMLATKMAQKMAVQMQQTNANPPGVPPVAPGR